jgi:hypothetical protein
MSKDKRAVAFYAGDRSLGSGEELWKITLHDGFECWTLDRCTFRC